MIKSIFITATGTGVGKTYTAKQLIKLLGEKGISAGVFKPIETGVETIPYDAKALLDVCKEYNKNFKHFTPRDITAYRFLLPAAPFCADTKRIIDINKIINRAKELQKISDILIIEGAGGLMVPIKSDYFMVDLAKELNAYTLLVTHSGLGCINETLCSIKVLKEYNLDYDWCVNIYKDRDSFKVVTKPFYDVAMPNWWSVEDALDMFVEKIINS